MIYLVLGESDSAKALFNENIAVVFQAEAEVEATFKANGIEIFNIGSVVEGDFVSIKNEMITLISQLLKQEILGTKHLIY